MRIGICCGPENATGLADADVNYIEATVAGALMPREDEARFAEALQTIQAAPLPVTAANCFLPGDLPCVGPDPKTDAILQYAETAFARARRVGVTRIVFGSGGSRRVPEGFDKAVAADQFIALLRKLGPLAEPHGVTVLIEPLNTTECNFINSLAEGAEMVRGADHPNVQLLADAYHMLRDGEPAEAIREVGAMLGHVHFAEAPRTPPGVSGTDFRPFLRALRDVGYAGDISLECRWDDLAAQAADAVRELRRQVADL